MELKDIAWETAAIVNGRDPKEWRKDACGALIHYKCYNKPGLMYCWEIDHIFPKSVLEKAKVPQELIDHPDNIRAFHRKNNESKSDNYPRYQAIYCKEGRDNIEKSSTRVVNESTQKKIKNLYKQCISNFKSGDMNP